MRLDDAFWAPRLRRNREVTLPAQYRLCEETGRIDNFRRAAGKIEGPFRGRYYNDSDVYKWLEAAAWSLAAEPDPALEDLLERVVREVRDAQRPDGYLNTYFASERAAERWTNLRDCHELYCAGHHFQAAVAHARCTGRRDLLEVALRFADHIVDVFGPHGREGACGHPEIEMALVELYRLTGRKAYLTQAERFLDMRGRKPPLLGGSPYHQDHLPFRDLDAVVGHAVRMMYACCGAADIVCETGRADYRAALERLWASMVGRRSYVTGGIGSRYEGEAFGEDYELPNERAYAETCAAIGSVMWNGRMLSLTGEARFADAMELALYNAFLAGLSLDGQHYFYENPLADTGRHRRQPWFDCACCPPNIARMLASLPGYVGATSDEGLWLHLYAAGVLEARLPSGGRLRLRVRTDYPWEGEIEAEVEEAEGPATLFVRIPGWCRQAAVHVNGTPVACDAAPGSYAAVRREWKAGDILNLELAMPPERWRCHPYAAENVGRVALRRGPLVYCIEETDVGVDPRDVLLPSDSALSVAREPGLLGGVTVLRAGALASPHAELWGGDLYRPTADVAAAPTRAIQLTAIPYFAWANREPGGMAVWIREA